MSQKNSVKDVATTLADTDPSLFMRLVSSRSAQLIVFEAVLIFVFFSLSNGAFLNDINTRGMLITASQVILITVTQAILMSAGHIDISQGAVLILSSVVGGKVILWAVEPFGPVIAILLGLVFAILTGIVVGLFNGFVVGVIGIHSLVATLGMLGIATGLAQVITGGVNLTGLPSELYAKFGGVAVAGIPLPMIVSLMLVLILWFIFQSTPWGTHVLAMGSNLKAAHRVGIKVLPKTIGVFVLSSTAAGMAGFIDLARYSTTNISGHTNDAIAAIAAALIGGTLLTGGKINFLGAIIGTFLAIILQSGLVIINLSPFYQTIAIGFMLLVAVSLDPSNRLRHSEP